MDDRDREPGGTPEPIGAELVLPAIALAYAIYYVITIVGLPWEAQANGLLIAAALGLLVLALFVRTGLRVARGEATLGLDRLLEPRGRLPARLGFLALMIASMSLIGTLGFTLTTFLFMAASMALLGVRSRRRILAAAAAVAVGGYVFFIAILDTRFPKGPVESLLAWVF